MIRVGTSGPERAKIMLVGEAPGAYEEQDGKPFVGPAGKMLRKFLMQAGINPNDCFLTNICKYRPPNNKLEKFFLPGGHPGPVVMAGLIELEDEIKRVNPNVIVALGNFPMWALTGKGKWNEKESEKRARGYSGIYDWRGSILPCTLVPGRKVVCTFHPSFINQNGYGEHGTWAADLSRVATQSAFPEIRYPEKNVRINPSYSERNYFKQEVYKRLRDPSAILTFDIEYFISEQGKSDLICVGMTLDRDNPIVIPTKNLTDINFVREVLTSGIGLNAQNSMFDCSVLEWHYQMPLIKNMRYDTMLAAHATNIELPKGLDYLCSIYTDQPYYKDMVDWKKVKAGKQPFTDVYRYNAIDTWVQHEVMEEQIRWDLTDPRARAVFEFEMQLLNPLWEISKRGVRVDHDAVKHLAETLDNEQKAYTAILNMMAGRAINAFSNIDVGWLLFQKFGLRPVKMNKTGPACDDKSLAALLSRVEEGSDEHTAITLVRDIKTRRSLISKFTEIELDDDGRLRGHYNPAGTDTGRLASKKFYPTGRGANQQNQPRDKRVRRVFLPDLGKKYGYADLERAESLVVAHITQDREMLRVHGPGIDAHRELAAELFGVRPEDVTDDQRYLGKKTRHAGNYMQGPGTFMKSINQESVKTGVEIDLDQATHYIHTYRAIHPGLQLWWDETQWQLLENRTLVNLLGRYRTFYSARPDGNGGISELPNAVAFVPQSTVGDGLNVALLQLSGVAGRYARQRGIVGRIAKWLPLLKEGGFEILQQIHDAFGFQYYEKYEDQVLSGVHELMRVPLTAPKTGEEFEIPVEIQAGPNWGDVEVYLRREEKWFPKKQKAA